MTSLAFQDRPQVHPVAATGQGLAGASTFAALAGYLLLVGLSWRLAGKFEFPLDDVYIHMAMAEQIMAGGYGVNAGEFASASSSPLFSLLLLPFAGQPAQIFLPVFWNLLGLIGAAWLWGRVVGDALGRDWLGWAIALAGPLALNLSGLAFAGMEHALHVWATMAVVRGIQLEARGDDGLWLLVPAVILGPVLRFEGLAVSAAAMMFLMFQGRMRLVLVLGLATLVPLILYGMFLTSLGLSALPNSVLAKLGDQPWLRAYRLWAIPGLIGLAWSLVALIRKKRGSKGWGAYAVLAPALFAFSGHCLLGQFGWMNRYEIYALFFLFAMGVVVIGYLGASVRLRVSLLLVLLFVGQGYWTDTMQRAVNSPRALSLQQAQMARFAKDYVQAPVAVNDLGYVVWRNPNYVLDLWGLASKEALMVRKSDPAPHWAGPLAERTGVELAMIYDNWLPDAVGSDWVKLGDLVLDVPTGVIAQPRVAFYATSPGRVATLNAKLEAFAPTLPSGAHFEFAEGL
ncbi:hypothetical protein [Aliiroseovarius crassostreae]|uniref:hypothetical protein n=1 Tax=Aliiroseovarius crassostreae TaxID=154981 RepID=UPI0021FEBBCA|nr:hypothetical protein [Aliiroseovarius crassostreae]UWQ03890.1 hypothetical protein K3X22_09255 [Aliiroseovarius crassostreae]